MRHKGILVKDGRALELMNDIDTVLFDKTGTLTREQPEVGRIIACEGYDPDDRAALCRGGRKQVRPSDCQGHSGKVQTNRLAAADV